MAKASPPSFLMTSTVCRAASGVAPTTRTPGARPRQQDRGASAVGDVLVGASRDRSAAARHDRDLPIRP